jgi:uncharacterized membrane protein
MKLTQTNWIAIIAVTFITIIGAILRYIDIAAAYIWIDEAWTLWSSQQSWLALNFVDVHPGGAYMIVKIVTMLLGTSVFTLRLPSLIFGVIGIPVTYWFAKEFTGKTSVGILSALLMALSVENIMQSDNARMYTMIPVFFMLFAIYFFRAYKEGGYKNWLITTAFAIAMMWTYYLMVIPLGITILWFIYKERQKVLVNKPFLWSAIIFVISMTLLALPFLRSLQIKSTEGSLLIYQGAMVPYQILITDFGSPPLLALLIGLFAIAGGILLWRDNKEKGEYITLVVISSLVVISIMSFSVMILPRYEDWALGIFYMLIALTVCSIPDYFKNNWKTKAMTGFIIVVLVSSFVMVYPEQYTQVHNYSGNIPEQVNQLINATPNADEIVLLLNPGSLELFNFYWTGTSHLDRFNSVGELPNLTKGYNTSYVLIPSEPVPDANIEGKKIIWWLNNNSVYSGDYRGMAVYKVKLNGS